MAIFTAAAKFSATTGSLRDISLIAATTAYSSTMAATATISWLRFSLGPASVLPLSPLLLPMYAQSLPVGFFTEWASFAHQIEKIALIL